MRLRYILLYTCLRRQRKWSEVQHPLGANGFMRGESVDRTAGAEKKWLCQTEDAEDVFVGTRTCDEVMTGMS